MKLSSSSLRLPVAFGLFAAGLAVGIFSPVHPSYGEHRSDDEAKGTRQGQRDDRGAGADGRGRTASGAENGGRPLAAADSKEFAAAVDAIFREPQAKQRRLMLEKLLERSTPEHLAALVDLIRRNDPRDFGQSAEWAQLWDFWSDRDAPGALKFIAAKDWKGWGSKTPWGEDIKTAAQRAAMIHLAASDPQAAVKYLEDSGEAAAGNRSMVYPLVRGWADQDPEAAAQWVLNQPGYAMAGEYRAVLNAYRRLHGEAAADQWFDQMTQGSVPAEHLPGMAQALVAQRVALDPQAAADWLTAHATAPWLDKSGVVGDVANAYGKADPEAAMAWAGRNSLDGAQTQIFTDWCARDSQAPLAWLDAHAADDSVQSMITIGSRAMAGRDMTAARQLAARISNDELRASVLQGFDNQEKQATKEMQRQMESDPFAPH